MNGKHLQTKKEQALSLLLIFFCLTPFKVIQAKDSFRDKWIIGTIGSGITFAGLYWLLKPASIEKVKKDADECYARINATYQNFLKINKTETYTETELVLTLRLYGQFRHLGFWQSLFSNARLACDAPPLIRGVAFIILDTQELARNLRKLRKLFGSEKNAQQEFCNYTAMKELKQNLIELALKIKNIPIYAETDKAFNDYLNIPNKIKADQYTKQEQHRYHNPYSYKSIF